MNPRGTILCSTEINAKFILSSGRVVGDADPYKASPFSDLVLHLFHLKYLISPIAGFSSE